MSVAGPTGLHEVMQVSKSVHFLKCLNWTGQNVAKMMRGPTIGKTSQEVFIFSRNRRGDSFRFQVCACEEVGYPSSLLSSFCIALITVKHNQ